MPDERLPICSVGDVETGKMKSFCVADREILIVNREDGYSAIAARCPHAGAPLENGVLRNNRIVCPWHNACFHADSGDYLEPPAQDNLVKYSILIEDGTVYLEQPIPDKEAKVPDLSSPNDEDKRVFVIVGGGGAGSAAAQTLREVGYQGRIVMLTAESALPYDRTKLSKAYLQSGEPSGYDLLRSLDFFGANGIEVVLSANVSRIDPESRQITYGEDKKIIYDAVLLATGGKPRVLDVEGADLANVFTLRQPKDANSIIEAAKDAKKAVVVGSGFIGMEVAASLRQLGLEVTVVTPNKVPFESVLGEAVGSVFLKRHQSEGVQFKLEAKVTVIRGDRAVASVELESGDRIPADIVVLGVGVKPATDFETGLSLNEDGSISVDKYLRVASNIYAAGDIAEFPYFLTGEPVRIEHWRLALQQGRKAAENMAGKRLPFESVPFFWTGQFDIKLRYIGHAEGWDDLVIQGSLEEATFLAFYAKDNQVLAVSGIGKDQDIAAISELMRLRKMPLMDAIKGVEVKSEVNYWEKQLAEAL